MLPRGQAYHLWILSADGSAHHAGAFEVGAEGRGFLTGDLDHGPVRGQVMIITAGPQHAVTTPTGPVHLAGQR